MKPEELKAHLRGVAVAPVVPMHDDGSVNLASVRDLTRFLVRSGLRDGTGVLVPLSSTGEFMSLTDAEFESVLATTIDAAAGEVLVVAGANHMDTRGVIRRSQIAQEQGAVGVLVGPSFYWKPTREEILDHFRRICDAVDIGVLVYNNYFATQYDLDPELLNELADLPNIVGMKETTREIQKFARVVATVGDRIAVLSGTCEWNEPCARLRGSPCFVSMLAAIAPELSFRLNDLMDAGDFAGAAALQRKLVPLIDFLFSDRSRYLGGLKAGLGLRGIPAGAPRSPFRPFTSEETHQLAQMLRQLGVPCSEP